MKSIEERISRLVLSSARIVAELRCEGEHSGADRFEAVTREVIANMRAEDERAREPVIPAPIVEREPAKVIDMMAALKASLEMAGRDRGGAA